MIKYFRIKKSITRKNKLELIEKYKRKRIIYLIACIIFLLLYPFSNLLNYSFNLMPNTYLKDYELAIHILDTGQGSATIINLKNEYTIMYDTGLSTYGDKIIKYIREIVPLKDNKIDTLILSHVDSDHTGNASRILQEFNPSNIYLPNMEEYFDLAATHANYVEFYNKAINSTSNIEYNYEGELIKFKDLSLTWISPNREYYSNTNNYSPIIKLDYKNYSMLLTGDSGHNIGVDDGINIEREALLYAEINNIDLDVDTLIAGHHGSKYSTSLDLLNSTTPNEILISVGNNSYGQPSNELKENIVKYDDINNKDLFNNIHTTLDENNIIVLVDSKDYKLTNLQDIENYLFVPFALINTIILIPLIIIEIDSIMICILLNKHSFDKNIEEV